MVNKGKNNFNPSRHNRLRTKKSLIFVGINNTDRKFQYVNKPEYLEAKTALGKAQLLFYKIAGVIENENRRKVCYEYTRNIINLKNFQSNDRNTIFSIRGFSR